MQAEFVAAMVTSVRRQTVTNWELIIVDDGSPDESAANARSAAGEDPRIRILQSPHAGVARARNSGLAAADSASRYVLFLDGDDELEPAMLERMTAYLDARPHVGAAHCLATLVDREGEVLPRELEPRYVAKGIGARPLGGDEPRTPLESILGLAGIIPSLVVIRRAVLVQVGGFDEDFGQGFEDTDLFLRLALAAPFEHIPEPLVRHRRHGAGSSDVPGRHDRQLVKLHQRWRNVDRWGPAEAAAIRKAWHVHDRQLALHRGRASARRLLWEGKPLTAARFFLGACRIALRSLTAEWR